MILTLVCFLQIRTSTRSVGDIGCVCSLLFGGLAFGLHLLHIKFLLLLGEVLSTLSTILLDFPWGVALASLACSLGLLLLATLLVFLVLTLTLLSLQNLTENSLSHHLVHLCLE